MEIIRVPISKPSITILPIGDIQYGPDAVDVGLLKLYIAWGVEHDAYYIGMGDYIDFASPSNRQALAGAALYDSARNELDFRAVELVDDLSSLLAATNGRWLGMVEGHHYWTFANGKTSDQMLAEKLGSPFLGTMAGIELMLPTDSIDIVFHHGSGGGMTPGWAFNKLNVMRTIYSADIYLMGHTHRRGVIAVDNLVSLKGKLLSMTQWLVLTGSFLRGYYQGSSFAGRPQGTYVEQRMLPPVALGGIVIQIDITQPSPISVTVGP